MEGGLRLVSTEEAHFYGGGQFQIYRNRPITCM